MRRFHLVLAGVLAALLSLVCLAGVADASASLDSVASVSVPYRHGTCVAPPELQPIEGHASTTDESVHGPAASRDLAHGCIYRYDEGWQPLARISGEPSYRYDGIWRTTSAFRVPPTDFVAAEDAGGAVVRHYTTDAAAESISKTGTIEPGLSSGKTWLTPDEYASGAEARAKLALNKTPDGYYEIPMCRVQCPSGPSTVEPFYGQPGGGTEITTGFPIDVSDLPFIRFGG